ncbi:MAG: hypothetical protein COA79_21020 [Planctomycetota bacterium]|nr:MAG: hypothetical protein COA79_21020 [Planctomycetota bacterium]
MGAFIYVDSSMNSTNKLITLSIAQGIIDNAISNFGKTGFIVKDIQIDNTLDPGVSPTNGDSFLVTDVLNLNTNFGVISGVENNDIIKYSSSGSEFLIDFNASIIGAGALCSVVDETKVYYFTGSLWGSLGLYVDHLELINIGTNSHNQIDTFIATKSQASGLAPLDSGSKVPLANLPDSVKTGSEFKGTWNASTNSPTLIDGTGANGDYYRVNVAGSQDLGSGSITYSIGDIVVYNGTSLDWEKVGGDGSVTSVAGKTGVVILDADDISETGSNKILTSTERTNISTSKTHESNNGSDHGDVVLKDGSRSFTAPQTGVAPTADLHLSTKKYVDDKGLKQYTAGVSLISGDWCYRSESDGKMYKTDASAESTSKGLISVCTETISINNTGAFRLVDDFTTTGLTADREYFLSTTAGAITSTKPTGSSEIVRSVGYSTSTTNLHVKISTTYIELVA